MHNGKQEHFIQTQFALIHNKCKMVTLNLALLSLGRLGPLLKFAIIHILNHDVVYKGFL